MTLPRRGRWSTPLPATPCPTCSGPPAQFAGPECYLIGSESYDVHGVWHDHYPLRLIFWCVCAAEHAWTVSGYHTCHCGHSGGPAVESVDVCEGGVPGFLHGILRPCEGPKP